MTFSDIHRRLRKANRALELTDMPAAAAERVYTRLKRPVRRGRLVFGLAAALAFGSVLMVLRPPSDLGGFALVHCATAELDDQETIGADGECELRSTRYAMNFKLGKHARVRHRADGVAVLSGRVAVHAQPRSKEEPRLIFVSHGRIEVVGTRFVVEQHRDGGSVQVSAGKIAFVTTDDERYEVVSRFNWPVAADPAAVKTEGSLGPPEKSSTRPQRQTSSRKKRPAQRAAAVPEPDTSRTKILVDDIVAEITALRSLRRYEEACSRLEAVLATMPKSRASERLSYELGSILSNHIHDTRRACEHWQGHKAKFIAQRYKREIENVEKRLGCGA